MGGIKKLGGGGINSDERHSNITIGILHVSLRSNQRWRQW